jgi:hypothetical protein
MHEKSNLIKYAKINVKSSSYFFLICTSVHLNLARATSDDKDGGVSLLTCNKRGNQPSRLFETKESE